MNLFYQPLLPQGALYLDGEESRHCVKVLRKRNGDPIRVTDGGGYFYDVVIEDANPSHCEFSIRSRTEAQKRNTRIHIAISPTRNPDRIEWFVEKATELGIDELSLIKTEHTEKSFIKRERLLKVAVSAMKQSLKATLPVIGEVKPFREIIAESTEDQQFIAYVDDTNPHHLKDVARAGLSAIVLVGPEGDFSGDELASAVAAGFQKVSLGQSRLRTETAGLAACHILNLVNNF